MTEAKFTDDDKCSCPMKCQLHQPFTDSDLKRLKEKRDDPSVMNTLTRTTKLDALLFRLEAAEYAIRWFDKITTEMPDTEPFKDYAAWRKAAGK